MDSTINANTVEGVAILLWAADPDNPELLATPFYQAAAAAAMDVPVEIYFTARSVYLLVAGVAEGLRASRHFDKTIGQTMQEAHEHGAKFYVCTTALHAQGINPKNLIPECSGHGGAVQFMARAINTRWRALVF